MLRDEKSIKEPTRDCNWILVQTKQMVVAAHPKIDSPPRCVSQSGATPREDREFRGPDMASHTVASILELLRDSRLLRAEETRALEGLATRARAPEELLEGACSQGWVTRYQIQELVAGRGEALLLGDYLVLAPIGEGGSARVFKGRHR